VSRPERVIAACRRASGSGFITIHAGSLDDSTLFQPRIAIFVRDRPAWVELPPRLTAFETLPP